MKGETHSGYRKKEKPPVERKPFGENRLYDILMRAKSEYDTYMKGENPSGYREEEKPPLFV